MTVDAIGGSNPGSSLHKGHVRCAWFNEHSEHKAQAFAEDALKAADDDGDITQGTLSRG